MYIQFFFQLNSFWVVKTIHMGTQLYYEVRIVPIHLYQTIGG